MFNINSLSFYVISPHGAGLQSLLYYLGFLGTPSSSWWWDKTNFIINEDDYPIPRVKNISNYGLTIDCVFDKKISISDCTQNIIWLFRDPIKLTCSVFNQGLGDSINPYNKDFRCNTLNSTFFDHYLANKKYYIMYSSQLRSVNCNGEILPIDTAELMPNVIEKTLNNVAQITNGNLPKYMKNLIKISYNAFESRFYREVKPYTYINYKKIFFCKNYLFDFHFNYWGKSYILKTIDIENQTWVIFTYDPDYKSIDINEDHVDMIKKSIEYIEVFQKIATEQYKKNILTSEQLVDWLKKNVKYYDKFMKILDLELVDVKKIAQEKVEIWDYYNML